jgi:hypothetical protein
MMKLIKQVFAAICSIIIELCKGTEAFAKSYTEVAESTHDYAKTLRVTPEQLAADLEIARVEHQIALVESLQKLKLRASNDPKLAKSIQDQLDAIENTFK